MAVDVPTLGEPVRRRRRFRVRSPKTLAVTVTFLVGFLILGTAGPSLTPDDPNALDLAGRLQPPIFDGGAWNHPLGTDDLAATPSAG